MENRERSSEEHANRFVDLVNAEGYWRSVDLRVCAIRNGRRWLNLVTRGFLDHRPPSSVPRFRSVKRPHFRAWQIVRPVADLPTVVRGIANGMMKLRPRYVRYVGPSGQAATDIGYSFNELDGSYRTAEYDLWSCHALVGYGSSIFEVVKQAGHDPFELDGMIRGGPNAYDGLPDLVRRFCARPRGLKIQGNATVVELIAPLAVRFERERTVTSPGCVTVAMRAAADAFVAKAELHWTVAIAGNAPHHESARLGDRKWTRDRDVVRSKLDVPVRSGDGSITLFIHIGNRCVDRLPVSLAGSNPRIGAPASDPDDLRSVSSRPIGRAKNHPMPKPRIPSAPEAGSPGRGVELRQVIIEAAAPGHWQDLQNAVGRILREAGFEVEIEKPVETVRGKVTVDVFARDDSADPRMTYLVECKHWKTAVPQQVVHAFQTTMRGSGANQGFIVSSGGFQSGAHAAVEKSNVDLLTWEEFQDLFAERWYRCHALPSMQHELDPLVEYTEPVNSRISRKADALPADRRQQFIRLRGEHRQLVATFDITCSLLREQSQSVLPPLPLSEAFAEQPDLDLPDDLLEAKALREFADSLVAHGREAIRQFDEVFGERA